MRQGQRLGDELAEDRRHDRHGERDHDDRDTAGGARAEHRRQPVGERLGDALPRERRGQEADEGDDQLQHGQEPAGLADEPVDPSCALVAFVDELLQPAPTDRHERDLGGHEHAR